jgi:UDP-glucuronate 4-epimerase
MVEVRVTFMKQALVTGGAGFIGSHLARKLLDLSWNVTVVDNFDSFYPRETKLANIHDERGHPGFRFIDADIRDHELVRLKAGGRYDVIVHLAAKAGVRPSILDPDAYLETNVKGTQNMLNFAREYRVEQFVFASSSSVYGVNGRVPWSESDHVLLPISPYAGTKVSGELMGHVYSRLFGIRFLALRFFTVYGPRQRPDLAIHKFARTMLKGAPIHVFGDGSTSRDYTYIDDIVEGIVAAIGYQRTRYEVINLGNHRTVSLSEMISTLEEELGCTAKLIREPDQPGDVPITYANIAKARDLLGYEPRTQFASGIRKFAAWLRGVSSVRQTAAR